VTLNVTGAISKSVDLEPFDRGGADLLFGGLGNDSVHGGAGQDAISGAEALPAIYNSPGPSGLVFSGEKFAAFNYSSPFAKIAAHPLNFDAAESDGADKLFGDPGNDWIVAGTGRDNLYGGPGNDLLNADDILETSTADTPPLDGPDIAFGGGGRDILISNATTDRIVDWVGEFNNYYVPFSPFGQSTIIRQIGPNVPEFIYGLGKSDGADQTRIGAGLGTAARNGEPFGELAVVLPGDAGYKDQQGPPVGPQPQ